MAYHYRGCDRGGNISAIVINGIRNKIKGKHSCSCGGSCGNCHRCDSCHKPK